MKRSEQKLVPGSWIEECLTDAGRCPVIDDKAVEEEIDPTNMVSEVISPL